MLAAVPESRIAWSDPRLRGAWAALAAAIVVGLVFLPSSFTNNDEYYYSGQAYVLSQGRVTPRLGDPLLLPLEVPAQAFRYPVAWPAVLVPARMISIRAMYALVLAVHVLGAAAVARMLLRRGARSALVAFYVFHPVFWLYSRTLLSDLPATAALVIAMDAWENRGRIASAGALGFAGAARLANVAAVLGFGLSVISDCRRRLSDVASLVVGVAVFWGAQLLVNHALGGYWLISSYVSQNALLLSGRMAVENLVLYLAGLALLPPFSLLFALARPRRVDRWVLVAATIVAAYLPMAWHNASASLLETLVGGQRYVMPAHAALLIATAGIWSNLPVLRRTWIPIAAGVAAAIVVSLAMGRLENRHRPAAEAVASCQPQTIAYNAHANKVVGAVRARSYEVTENPPAKVQQGWDVLVLAPGVQSNQLGFTSHWTAAPPHLDGAICRRVGAYAIYDFTGRCPSFGDSCEQR